MHNFWQSLTKLKSRKTRVPKALVRSLKVRRSNTYVWRGEIDCFRNPFIKIIPISATTNDRQPSKKFIHAIRTSWDGGRNASIGKWSYQPGSCLFSICDLIIFISDLWYFEALHRHHITVSVIHRVNYATMWKYVHISWCVLLKFPKIRIFGKKCVVHKKCCTYKRVCFFSNC